MRIGVAARAAAAGLLLAFWLPPAQARAGEADVLAARAWCNARSVCRFAVRVRHADEGWDHYANRWEVLGPDGQVLATRVLRHPHVDEQPFTRTLEGVEIPDDVARVTIRASDSVHGTGGKEVEVTIQRKPAAGAGSAQEADSSAR